MTPWLNIIGVGDGGLDDLPPKTQALVNNAEIIVTSKRLIGCLEESHAELLEWSSPLQDTIAKIASWKGRNVIVLATGDPMHFGIASALQKQIPQEEMIIFPSPSAFSLAAARLGWQLQKTEMISLHGRPTTTLHSFIEPGVRIIALTEGEPTIRAVTDILKTRGYGKSRMTILEHMAGDREKIIAFPADEYAGQSIAEFSTLAIECIADEKSLHLPHCPGLPDEAFTHDGQMTKREVRAITLAALSPGPDALLWDVGAGCGSIAIEWMRSARGARAIAFEKNPERIAMISANSKSLGVPDLLIVEGKLPQTLENQPRPDAVFIGGAVSDWQVFETCWHSLKQGGNLIANSVTLEGEAALISYHSRFGGELARIDISIVKNVGSRHAMQPRMAVLQWRARKS